MRQTRTGTVHHDTSHTS